MSTKAGKKTIAKLSFDTSGNRSLSPPPTTSTPIKKYQSDNSWSPTCCSRLQEKQELQNLNDRLACYIDKVRYVEAENLRLTREVQTVHETVTREVTSIKSMYEQELSDTRKLLDNIVNEAAKQEIEKKRVWEDNKELQKQLETKIQDYEIVERNLNIYETRYADLSSQLNKAESVRKKLYEKERELEKEVEKLKVALDGTRKSFEEETLQRIALENRLRSLKDEITFKDQVYQQELAELRTRRQAEISEIDGQLAKKYETKLQQSLQELRDRYEAQIQANREEIESLYENNINNLKSQVESNSNAASVASEELKYTRLKIDELNQRIVELEAFNNALEAQSRNLENLREIEHVHYGESLISLETELTRLRDQMAKQLQEYQDLMNIKVTLDLEIAVYRKLLESEEARLNIKSVRPTTVSEDSRSTASKHTTLKSGKQKRSLIEESEEHVSIDNSALSTTKDEIKIADVDPKGRYVKITNKGNKEIGLNGWQIIHRAGSSETVFKFHQTVKIDAGASVIVWSAGTDATHEPPANIVMKGQKWFTAAQMTTILLNNESEEVEIIGTT